MWTDASQLLSSHTAASSVIARKLATKLVQRIGLTFLPATVAAWRYQQSSVSINDSLSNIGSGKPDTESVPAESAAPSLSQPDGSDASAAAAGQQHQSPGGAHGLTKQDSRRPALQPSLLVNASPVTFSTDKPCTHVSDRQYANASPQEDGTAKNNLPGQSASRLAASDRQTQGLVESAAAAQMNSEQDIRDGAPATDGDYDEDIPEEVEEVYMHKLLPGCKILGHAASVMCELCNTDFFCFCKTNLLCCAVLCCAVLCCAVLCCPLLCCAVLFRAQPCFSSHAFDVAQSAQA